MIFQVAEHWRLNNDYTEDRLLQLEKGMQKCIRQNIFDSLRTNTTAELIFWINKIKTVN